MKKKIVGLLLCFTLLSMSILTGCSLFTTNMEMYYNTVVSTLEKDGKTLTITKRELIESYSNYGAMYEQYYGYTTAQAYDMSLTIAENRKITVAEGENIVAERGGLTDKEKDYIWSQTVDALYDNFTSYYDEIVGTTDPESTSEDTISFTGYTKTAKIENGQIIRQNVPTSVIDGYTDYDENNKHDYSNEEDLKEIYTNFVNYVTTSGNENYEKAFDAYKDALITSERGLNLSTDTVELFDREIDRLARLMYENYIVEVFSEEYDDDSEISSVTINDVLALYSSKVRKGYVQYEIENDSSYDTTIQENAAGVYYYKNGDEDTKYFTVANILLMFDDKQQALYNSYYEKFYGQSSDDGDPPEELVDSDVSYDGNYSREQYEADLDALYSQLKPVVREKQSDGTYVEKQSSLTQEGLLSLIQTELSNASSVTEKADLINDYIYMYGEDTGMFNAKSCYVIGQDSDGNAVSSFVDAFNDAGLALYNNGAGQFGDTSDYVRTNYGLHIVIYTGPAENENIARLLLSADENYSLSYAEGDENNPDSAIYILYNTRVNPLVDKTYFDVLYDELYQEDQGTYESMMLENAREGYSIVHYTSRYSDLF